jgi:23S rRNA (uridine2552-2'-O)-methyltransferase
MCNAQPVARNPQPELMKPKTGRQNPWQDHYSRQAKKDRYPARSVYKLEEIQQKQRLIKKGDKILDLGCSPGSWLLYAAKLIGDKGRVVGIDLKPVKIQAASNIEIMTGDVFAVDAGSLGSDFNVVLSDMAPATTGHKAVDAARSAGLCEAALAIAKNVLLPGGSFVCKIFQGPDFNKFIDSVRASFDKQKIFKPRSSRKASKEIFVIGLGFKNNLIVRKLRKIPPLLPL